MSASHIDWTVDSYDSEYQQFQRDVHILIEGTLRASVEYLDSGVKVDLERIGSALTKVSDEHRQQHLVDEHVDVLETNNSQERFLRNMALVALASRLIHALHIMARAAELFSKRKRRYGKKHDGDFAQLWAEYQERFEIDFSSLHSDKVAFAETMRAVRNRVVHNGGEANEYKFLDDIDLNAGDAGYLDLTFSQKYPEYVQGDGTAAEVNVTEDHLAQMIDASVKLVGWLAKELRVRELASIQKGDRIH